jgi:hypothetical protein
MSGDELLITVGQAAKLLNYTSEAALRMAIVRGTIPPSITKHVGSRVFLVKEKLEAWVRRGDDDKP